MEPESVLFESPFTGNKYKINLTQEELSSCATDQNYFHQLAKKYDDLEKNGLIRKYIDDGESQETNELADAPETVTYETHTLSAPQLVGKSKIEPEDEEYLILAVQPRVILWDHRIPLKQRSKQDVKALWDEVIAELGVNMSVEDIKAKWKIIRDSYIRARNLYKKKIPSGASAVQKQEAERALKKHRNYNLLTFLDQTFANRQTATNLDTDTDESRPSTSHSYRGDEPATTPGQSELTASDAAFQEVMKGIASAPTPPATQQLSASQHFCLHLAERMDRLPRSVKSEMQIKILEMLAEAEAKYLD